VRPSSLPLLTRCAGSETLPRDDRPESEESRRALAWGTAAHHWKATGKFPEGRLGRDLRAAVEASGIDRDVLWPAGGGHEVFGAVRVDGVREGYVAEDHPRPELEAAMRAEPSWLCGTADYVGWEKWRALTAVRDVLWVDDLKTGKFYANPPEDDDLHDPRLAVGANRFPVAADSPQLLAYALMQAVRLNYTGPVVLSITHWPRLPLERRHAPPTRTWHVTHTDALHAFWDKLERVAVAASLGILAPGPHCKFCPSRKFCPELEE